MKAISDYEKKANIKIWQKVKNQLKSDIHMFVTKKKPKQKRPAKDIAGVLKSLGNRKIEYHIFCSSKEEYAKCAEAVIVYDLSYEKDVKKQIQACDTFYDSLHYLSLKRAIIQVLYENGEIDEEHCIELIKSNEAPQG